MVQSGFLYYNPTTCNRYPAMCLAPLDFGPGNLHPVPRFKMEGRLSATILKWDHQRTILAKFNFSWFSRFREDLNVIIKNTCMSDLHTPYKLAEGTSSQKNREDMLNYSFPCSCSQNWNSFQLIIKQL